MNTDAEQPAENADARSRMLIADDDPVARARLGSRLDADFTLIGPATDAAEGIRLAERNQPDAALIDAEMGVGVTAYIQKGVTGSEVAETLTDALELMPTREPAAASRS